MELKDYLRLKITDLHKMVGSRHNSMLDTFHNSLIYMMVKNVGVLKHPLVKDIQHTNFTL